MSGDLNGEYQVGERVSIIGSTVEVSGVTGDCAQVHSRACLPGNGPQDAFSGLTLIAFELCQSDTNHVLYEQIIWDKVSGWRVALAGQQVSVALTGVARAY
jgi:hypothetical protein